MAQFGADVNRQRLIESDGKQSGVIVFKQLHKCQSGNDKKEYILLSITMNKGAAVRFRDQKRRVNRFKNARFEYFTYSPALPGMVRRDIH